MMLDAILAALSAAALFAVATAFQHRSAWLVAADGPGNAAGLAGLVLRTLRQPLWIAGTIASLAGLGLHALALQDGPLTLVQPLLVTGVIFALPLRQLLEHRRPRTAELGWAAVLALGLTVFLAVATPADSSAQAPDPWPAVICVAALALAIGGCWGAARRMTGSAAAVTLGTAAGLASAATAALLKETTGVFPRGPGAVLTTWPCYALAAVGGLALLLNQLAYQAGPLRVSLPAITTVNPIASLVIGVAVFDERFRGGPGFLAGELLGLVLIAAAAVRLARSGPDDAPEPAASSAAALGQGRTWRSTRSCAGR
jgi:drug/metabolite transporter (DMT)-like permease